MGEAGPEPKEKPSGLQAEKPAEKNDIDSLAGVDIYFKFHTVARYVGLVKANDVDFLRDEKDHILVNDDLQQDLQRVARLFSLTVDDTLVDQRCQFQRPMHQRLKKGQIIKSIPFYFKQGQEAEGQGSQDQDQKATDNRVFFFNEIQRKIIYGILRRMYALVAETFHEMLLMLPRQSIVSIAMAQKYFGHLLYTQRQDREVVMFTQKEV